MTPANQERMDRIEAAVNTLMEHFDTVQVFATLYRPEEDAADTLQLSSGKGSWYARYGQVREWVIREEERSRDDVRRERGD